MWVRRLVSIVGVTCAVAAVAGIWHVLDRPVDTIVVSGEPTQAEREWVEQALSSVPLGGILSTDLEAIESQLITMGWTRQVTVRRHWPDRLEVRLHKVVPVARWGAQGYLAANGEPMELPDEHYDLPELSASGVWALLTACRCFSAHATSMRVCKDFCVSMATHFGIRGRQSTMPMRAIPAVLQYDLGLRCAMTDSLLGQ